MAKVRFHYLDVNGNSLKDKKRLKEFIPKIFEWEGRVLGEINYIFCTDNFLLEINKSYLQHDFYTDIITFDLSEDEQIVGEIYISMDRVRENSILHDTSCKRELLRVVFHAVLHLVGYRDKKKSEITIMREKEDYYLRLFEKK